MPRGFAGGVGARGEGKEIAVELDPSNEEIRQLSAAMLMTLTAMCKHMLGNAENYVEMQLHEPEGGTLTVRVQRHDGKTPHELRKEAEAAAKYWEKRARELGAEDY
jgi:hypothetical protein